MTPSRARQYSPTQTKGGEVKGKATTNQQKQHVRAGQSTSPLSPPRITKVTAELKKGETKEQKTMESETVQMLKQTCESMAREFNYSVILS